MFLDGFPNYLRNDVDIVVKKMSLVENSKVSFTVSDNFIHYYINGEAVTIPYRMYYLDCSDTIIEDLTPN